MKLSSEEIEELIDEVADVLFADEVLEYTTALQDLATHGGYIYRVLFTPPDTELVDDGVGRHWTYSPHVFDNIEYDLADMAGYQKGWDTWFVEGLVRGSNVDVGGSLQAFYEFPIENEILIKDPDSVDVVFIDRLSSDKDNFGVKGATIIEKG